MASLHGNFAHLLNPNYKTDVTHWLAEDCPSFDYGGFVVGEAKGEARLLGKSEVGNQQVLYIDIVLLMFCSTLAFCRIETKHCVTLSDESLI